MLYKVTNLSKNTILAQRCELANTPFKRAKGLLGRSGLGPGEGLIIQPCSSIHTLFMRFSIDVLFLNRQNRVIGLYKEMQPFRLSRLYFLANKVIELPPGVINQTNTQIGDLIQIEQGWE